MRAVRATTAEPPGLYCIQSRVLSVTYVYNSVLTLPKLLGIEISKLVRLIITPDECHKGVYNVMMKSQLKISFFKSHFLTVERGSQLKRSLVPDLPI